MYSATYFPIYITIFTQATSVSLGLGHGHIILPQATSVSLGLGHGHIILPFLHRLLLCLLDWVMVIPRANLMRLSGNGEDNYLAMIMAVSSYFIGNNFIGTK